jgi:hypothetical protein
MEFLPLDFLQKYNKNVEYGKKNKRVTQILALKIRKKNI